jgi:hypothetical protein
MTVMILAAAKQKERYEDNGPLLFHCVLKLNYTQKILSDNQISSNRI